MGSENHVLSGGRFEAVAKIGSAGGLVTRRDFDSAASYSDRDRRYITSPLFRRKEARMRRNQLTVIGLVAAALLLNAASQVRSASIYWSDANGGDIRRANLDGMGQ